MDELEQIRADMLARKLKQNERRAKAGKKPMHPELVRKTAKKTPSRASKPPPAPSGEEADTNLSFDEWKACGWSVKRGEKCSGFDAEGIPQFNRSQVRKTNSWKTSHQTPLSITHSFTKKRSSGPSRKS
jgi:hypothetical protein